MLSSQNSDSTSFEQERRLKREEEWIRCRENSSSSVGWALLCSLLVFYILTHSFLDLATGHLKPEPVIVDNGGNGVTPTTSVDPAVATATNTTATPTISTTTPTQEIVTVTTSAQQLKVSTTQSTEAASTAASTFEASTNPETGFPPLTSEDDWASIKRTCSKQYAGCAVYVMEKSGMGSALFGVFKHRIMHRILGRPYFIVNESRYPYYRSPDGSTGVLTTFFTPTCPIIPYFTQSCTPHYPVPTPQPFVFFGVYSLV